MSGDRHDPVDANTLIIYGRTQAIGHVAGMTVAEAKEAFARAAKIDLPQGVIARLSTLDPSDAAWKAVPSKEVGARVGWPTEWGVRTYPAVAKVVPDTYRIRPSDICLALIDPPQTPYR